MSSHLKNLKIPAKLKNFGLGKLYSAKNDREVKFQPYEISSYRIGMILEVDLAPMDYLTLKTIYGPYELQVSHIEQLNEKGFCAYQMVSVGLKKDFDALLSHLQGHKEVDIQGNSICLSHFETIPSLKLQVKTFGTFEPIPLESVYVSRMGMQLASVADEALPYNEKTILEAQIDELDGYLSQPIKCQLRIKNTESYSGVQTLSVEFIDFEGDGLKLWDEAVKRFEATFLSKRIPALKDLENAS